jgi:hypothetical protein
MQLDADTQSNAGATGTDQISGRDISFATDSLKSEQSDLNAGTSICIGLHSFLVLAAAITLGPLTSALQLRQISLGLLFAAVGLLTALFQTAFGRASIRQIRNSRTLLVGSSGPIFVRNWELFMGIFLPFLLLGFWLMFGTWLLWRW